MIELTKLNGDKFFLNAEIIETVECVPDTMIVVFTGKRYIVREKSDEVIQKIIEYKQKAYSITASMGKYLEMVEERKRER
ncbi:MAG: flagellar FlbD family protein [Thermotogota bacterium]|nr:flagellar FlbD family protein [Thermotogota bacterium]